MSILDCTAVELGKKIKSGEVTVVEATKAVLDQIEKSDNTYHCFVTVNKEAALKKAEEIQILID